MLRIAVTAMLMLIAATPASAASYIINAVGQLSAPPAPDTIPGLPFANGNAVFGSWRVDLDPASGVNIPSPGGTGAARRYPGTVRNGVIAVSTSSGVVLLTQTAASNGSIIVIDNGSILRPMLPTLRLDQVGITDGLGFAPGPVQGYAATGLASDVLVRSIAFGRSMTTLDPALPGLVNSAALPDLGTIFSGPPYFFSFTLIQGNPQTPGAVAGLPFRTFSVIGPQVFLAAIPEPGSWALLIIGFGVVGAALRRVGAATPVPCI